LTPAALAEIAAGRFHAIRRRLDDFYQSRAGEVFLDLREFRLNHFAGRHERNKHDKFPKAADSFAAKGNVVNRQANRVARGWQ
jgi:hypothetical protein